MSDLDPTMLANLVARNEPVALAEMYLRAEYEMAEVVEKRSALLMLTEKQARENVALRGQLTQLRRSEPLARDITAILKLWRSLCSTKRSSIELDGKRAAVVRTALKTLVSADPGASPEEQRRQRRRTCMDAVRGLALRPYVVNAQRKGQGAKEQRYCDIEHALKDEKHIEEHAGFYRMAQAKPSEWAYRAWEAAMQADMNWRIQWEAALERERLERNRDRIRENPERVAEVAAQFGLTFEQLANSMTDQSTPDRPHLFLIEGEAAA